MVKCLDNNKLDMIYMHLIALAFECVNRRWYYVK